MKKSVVRGLILASVLTVSSFGAVDVTGVTLDTAPVEAIAAVMLAALGLIWVAKRVVGFLR